MPKCLPNLKLVKPLVIDQVRGRLFSRSRVSGAKGEDLLAIQVADALKKMAEFNNLHAVFTHVANEGKRSSYVGNKSKAMGMIPGAADFVFTWKGGSGWIELKHDKGKQTDCQRDFEYWCKHEGVDYAVCRSLNDVFATLKTWGVV